MYPVIVAPLPRVSTARDLKSECNSTVAHSSAAVNVPAQT